MTKQGHGIYREKNGWGSQDSARVTDGTIGVDVSEAQYRERAYQPPFDKLPWKSEYDAAQKRDVDSNLLAKGIVDKATAAEQKASQPDASPSKDDNKTK